MEKSMVKAQGIKIVAILMLVVLTGCASNYKDFKVSNVDENEGIAIGKVSVIYNGKPHNEECKVCISETCHELTKEGYVFMSLARGTAYIEVLYCDDGITKQNQAVQGAHFEVLEGVTYFGDVTFVWGNENPHTFMNAVGVGMVGGAALQSAVDARLDGEISMKVEDDLEPVETAYHQHTRDESISVEKSITSVGYQPHK